MKKVLSISPSCTVSAPESMTSAEPCLSPLHQFSSNASSTIFSPLIMLIRRHQAVWAVRIETTWSSVVFCRKKDVLVFFFFNTLTKAEEMRGNDT